jgi:hypothetical protein
MISASYILADYKYILRVLPVTALFRFLRYIIATVCNNPVISHFMLEQSLLGKLGNNQSHRTNIVGSRY